MNFTEQTKAFFSKYRKPVVVGTAIVVLAGVGYSGFNALSAKKKPAELPPLVKTQTIKPTQGQAAAQYPGEVRGRFESQQAFQVSGKLARRAVELGSTVRAGEVLMEIDPKDIQQTVNITSAQVQSAQSQLQLAENNLKRFQLLYEQGAVSKAVYEQYQNAHAAALATSRVASAQYSQGSNQLGYTELRAVSDGVVSAILAESGQVVAAGQPVLTLVHAGEREVEISVPENRHQEIAQASKIAVTFWALPSQVIDGKVREISPMADPVTRTYKVRIHLLNPPPDLKLGMTASVRVFSNHTSTHSIVPLSAIYQSDQNPGIWVVRENKVSLRPVKLGAFGDNTVQVLAGIEPEEQIVIAGVHKLKEGQTIRLAGDSR